MINSVNVKDRTEISKMNIDEYTDTIDIARIICVIERKGSIQNRVVTETITVMS